MSTVERGRSFEGRVLDAITRELNAQRLGLLPASCKVHLRKGYYSIDRKSDIEIDIAIEVYLPDAPTWSLLWAWECKDYVGTVPASDVEEFWAKLQQVAGENVKGGIVTSGPLQHAALQFALSKGLSIVRLLPDDKIRWISYGPPTEEDEPLKPEALAALLEEKKIRFQIDCRTALCSGDFYGTNCGFYALSEGQAFSNWRSLIEEGVVVWSVSRTLRNKYGDDFDSLDKEKLVREALDERSRLMRKINSVAG